MSKINKTGFDKVAKFYDALNVPSTKDVKGLVESVVQPEWRSFNAGNISKGRDEFINQVIGFGKMIPDLKWDVQSVLWDAQANRVIVHSIASGTPAGDFMGVPHTGNKFEVYAIDIHTLDASGKAIRADHVEDWAGAIRALKAGPQTAAPAAPAAAAAAAPTVASVTSSLGALSYAERFDANRVAKSGTLKKYSRARDQPLIPNVVSVWSMMQNKLHIYKERHVDLYSWPGRLQYSEPNGGPLKGVILVKRNETVVESYELNETHKFCFRVKHLNDEINFDCSSEEERAAWVAAIQEVIAAPTPEEVAADQVKNAKALAEANVAAARAAAGLK